MSEKCPFCGAEIWEPFTILGSRRWRCKSREIKAREGWLSWPRKDRIERTKTCYEAELATAKGLLLRWRHVTYKGFIALQDETDAFLHPAAAEGGEEKP